MIFYKNQELVDKHKALVATYGEDNIFEFMKKRPILSRLNRFGTYGSKKRQKLFIEGFLTYAYCYITFEENGQRFKANVIFSPDPSVTDQPQVLENVYKNLEKFKLDYEFHNIPHSMENKKLYNNLFSMESDPSFVHLPDRFTEGKYVQLNMIEFEKDFAMPNEMGKFYLIICFNSKISSMVMPYPDKYLVHLKDF